ncbi:threonine synthase [Candidatus Gottesmanbacteria bacterium]|nr:threonine synthase [Candidatus Gottesmanbacteria bacterium]
MNKNLYYLSCVACHKKTDELKTTSRCLSCRGPLDVTYDYDELKKQVNAYILKNTPSKTLKYLDFYPLKTRDNLISLQEGGTPLHQARRLGEKIGIPKLFIKNEGLNPTGAFKDRGSFIEINKAKELGYSSVCVASTGNMAASVAAYSAQAGLSCFVFVPENTPRGKLAQSLSYGAKVIQVRGTYTEANTLAEKTAKTYGYYLAGDYVFRSEGQKSLGFELAESTWEAIIDWVIVPVGMGTNLASIWKGFWEYYRLGFIEKLPKLIAVQAYGCHSIFQKTDKSEFFIKPVKNPKTINSAIAVGNPLDGVKVIEALNRSHGMVVSVSDEETLAAQQELAHLEALYIEPSSATTIVALKKLLRDGTIQRDDRVVCVATGAGLKDPAATLKVLAEPPTIEPDEKEVKRVISGNLFALRAQGVRDKEKILFSSLPTKSRIQNVVKDEFGIKLPKRDLEETYLRLRQFIKDKGKVIGRADLQSILEGIIQQETKNKYLTLTDFQIWDTKNKRPKATIDVLLHGKKYHAQSDGVGPVDAAISAINKVIAKHDGLKFKLSDFTVEIPTTGSDSTVEVTMVLQAQNGTQVVEKGTSPDIIVASMNAYVAGYNELYYQVKNHRKEKSL